MKRTSTGRGAEAIRTLHKAARIENQRPEGVDLVDRVSIEVHTCNFRSIRGYTVVLAIFMAMRDLIEHLQRKWI